MTVCGIPECHQRTGPEQGADMRCLGHVPGTEKGARPRALAVQGRCEGEEVTLLQEILPPLAGVPSPCIGLPFNTLTYFDFDPQPLLD